MVSVEEIRFRFPSVENTRFGVSGLGFGTSGLGFRVWGMGFQVWGYGVGFEVGCTESPWCTC